MVRQVTIHPDLKLNDDGKMKNWMRLDAPFRFLPSPWIKTGDIDRCQVQVLWIILSVHAKIVASICLALKGKRRKGPTPWNKDHV
jgi:hypothetical protein